MLATKLHVPRTPVSFVVRPRLAERLDAAPPGAAVLVCAPAGFGKSAFVAEWCRRAGRSVAWVSLDPDDGDPIRFWRHVAAAIDLASGHDEPGLEAAVDRHARGVSGPPLDELVAAVVNGLADQSVETVLVLDDYHLIRGDEVHAGVRLLLERAPETLRVIIITRADPPLLLSRRRARGELVEIRGGDLRFETVEVADFLDAATGVRLSPSDISRLTERTEGWPAGLQLAALSLEGRDDTSEFIATFSGSHRFVLDYLTEEVLDRQPATIRDFLIRTSILGRLSGSACDAVTGGTDGQELLEACERANLFVVPLDDDRRWWRYHHLFAELLRTRLDRRPTETVRELHRRAADWHETEGLIEPAIDHAIAAGDPARAMRIIERHADEFLLRREGAALRRRLADLPDGADTSRRLLVAHARTAGYAGRPSEAEALVEAASEAGVEPADRFEPSIDPAVSPLATLDPTTDLVHAFVAHLRGRGDDAAALASSVLADLDDDESAVAVIAGFHVASEPWFRGAVDESEPLFMVNVDRWRTLGAHDRAALASHHLARMQRARGDLDAAIDTYRRTLALDAGADSGPTAVGVGNVGLAEVAYRRGEIDDAERYVAAGIAASRQLVFTQTLSSGLATSAQLHRLRGDVRSARAALDEAIDVGPDSDVIDLLNPVPVLRAQLLLADGDPNAAEEWVDHRGVGIDDAPLHTLEPVHLLVARLAISRGDAPSALPLLHRLRAAAAGDGRAGSVIEIDVLRALALAGVDRLAAVDALTGAVALAAPQRHVRVFADEGAAITSLLGEVIASAPTGDRHAAIIEHVGRLIRAFDTDDTTDGEPPAPRQLLVVPLTDRELEVLGHLASGKPNREIAEALYVSLNTVKKHLTHIFDKLGTTNRTAAVDRARALDLLDRP